jgi:hypothetical protein
VARQRADAARERFEAEDGPGGLLLRGQAQGVRTQAVANRARAAHVLWTADRRARRR